MPEFYIIIARKIFYFDLFFFWGGGTCPFLIRLWRNGQLWYVPQLGSCRLPWWCWCTPRQLVLVQHVPRLVARASLVYRRTRVTSAQTRSLRVTSTPRDAHPCPSRAACSAPVTRRENIMIFSKISKYRNIMIFFDVYRVFSIFSKFYLCITSNKLFNDVYPDKWDNSVFIDYYQSFVPSNAKLTVI